MLIRGVVGSPVRGVVGSGFGEEGLLRPQPPEGFGWTPPVVPMRQSGGWVGNVTTESLKPDVEDGVTYWVDPDAGSNANPGTEASPFKTMAFALAKTDAGIINVAPSAAGIIYRDERWGSNSPATTKPGLIVQKWALRAGDVISTTCWNHTAGLWTQDGTYPNVWNATRSAVAQILDRNATAGPGGALGRYSLQASKADAAAVPGSYYLTGSALSVATLDGLIPSSDILVFLAETNARIVTDKTIYLDGIKFWGGNRAMWVEAATLDGEGRIIFKDADFKYATDASNGNGLDVDGFNELILDNCEAAFNRMDGFNYQPGGGALAGLITSAVEINCRGFWNGTDSSGINNGTSMHGAGRIARYGGEHYQNDGPNVPDVGDSRTWNVGVYAHDSRRASGLTNADFYNSTGKSWLFECRADGASTHSSVSSNAEVFTDRCAFAVTPTNSGTGTTAAYVQT